MSASHQTEETKECFELSCFISIYLLLLGIGFLFWISYIKTTHNEVP